LENYRKAIVLDQTNTEFLDELAKLASSERLHLEAADYYNKLIGLGADKTLNSFLVGREYYFEGEQWRMRYDSLKRLQQTSRIAFTDSSEVRNKMLSYYHLADSAFELVCQLNAAYAGGNFWKGGS